MGKKNKDSLGRALIKDRFAKNRHRKHVEDNTMVSICFYIIMFCLIGSISILNVYCIYFITNILSCVISFCFNIDTIIDKINNLITLNLINISCFR